MQSNNIWNIERRTSNTGMQTALHNNAMCSRKESYNFYHLKTAEVTPETKMCCQFVCGGCFMFVADDTLHKWHDTLCVYVTYHTIPSFFSMACTFTNSLALSSPTENISWGLYVQESNRLKLERRDLLERPILVKRFSFFFFSFNSRSTIYCTKYSNTHTRTGIKRLAGHRKNHQFLHNCLNRSNNPQYNHAGNLIQI